MGAEITAAERNDLYRLSALSYFNPVSDQPANSAAIKVNGAQAVTYQVVNGLHQVTLTMPDGTKEYWAQTNAAYCVDTGFKAMAFERRNADFKIPVLDQNGSPQVQVVFPGSTQTRADLRASQLIVHGNFNDPAFTHLMDEYTKDRTKFMNEVAQGIQSRRAPGQGDARVAIGGHSIGVNAAIGAAQDLQQKGIGGARTFLIEPVGAGQRVQYLATKGLDPDQLDNVISIRDKNQNLFQGVGGVNRFANSMIGTPFTIDTGIADNFGGHMSSAIATSIASGRAITPDHASIISANDLVRNAPSLSASEIESARGAVDGMTRLLDATAARKTTLTQGFNGTTDLPPAAIQSQPVAQPAPSQTTPVSPQQPAEPIEVVLNYLEGRGYQCNSPAELNRALARCFTEAQLTDDYKTAFERIYNKPYTSPDFMPGEATREAMEKKGVPANVLAALDSLNMFDKSQRNDLYEPPSRDSQEAVMKLARETPLLFEQTTEVAMAGSPAAPAARAGR
jgi:hypothetical protein